jgi:hypothetical protein
MRIMVGGKLHCWKWHRSNCLSNPLGKVVLAVAVGHVEEYAPYEVVGVLDIVLDVLEE